MESPLNGELVGRAVAGDRLALDELWRGHRRLVAAVLLSHLPRTSELQDLLQDVAAKMVAQIHRLKTPESFRPWLCTVARNVARSHGRRVQTRGSAATLEDEPVDPTHERERHRRPARDRLEGLMRIVHGLHPDYREPLLMRTVQGMSQNAIAEALELPVTTVETRLARARRMLRAEVGRVPSPARVGSKSRGSTP